MVKRLSANDVLYRSSSNRTMDAVIHSWEQYRQPEVLLLCHSAVGDIAALQTAILFFSEGVRI